MVCQKYVNKIYVVVGVRASARKVWQRTCSAFKARLIFYGGDRSRDA